MSSNGGFPVGGGDCHYFLHDLGWRKRLSGRATDQPLECGQHLVLASHGRDTARLSRSPYSLMVLASVDWGSVPEWFAAIGTVGALFVALILLRNELADRRRAAEVADRRPADGIFAWAEPRTDAGGWQTFVHNRSDEPIYDAVVYFTPLTDPPLPTEESVWGTVPPGGPKAGDRYGDRPGDLFGIPPVEIEFTDGRGRHWRRDDTGQLQRLDTRHPFD